VHLTDPPTLAPITSPAPGTLHYTITVTNTPNTDLHTIILTCAEASPVSIRTESISSNGVLNVGENWVYTATYEVTQTDINTGTRSGERRVGKETEHPGAE